MLWDRENIKLLGDQTVCAMASSFNGAYLTIEGCIPVDGLVDVGVRRNRLSKL